MTTAHRRLTPAQAEARLVSMGLSPERVSSFRQRAAAGLCGRCGAPTGGGLCFEHRHRAKLARIARAQRFAEDRSARVAA